MKIDEYELAQAQYGVFIAKKELENVYSILSKDDRESAMTALKALERIRASLNLKIRIDE